MLDHAFSEEIDPYIQSKPHLAQLESIPLILKTYERRSGFTKHKVQILAFFSPLLCWWDSKLSRSHLCFSPLFSPDLSLTLAACYWR